MEVQLLQWSRIASFAYPTSGYAGSKSMTPICDFPPKLFSRAIHNLNPLWLVTTKEQLLILQKYFMLRSVVLLSILAVCLCVVQTKLNCQIKGREMGGNRWKLVNSESGSGPTSFTMFWIKDQTPRVSPLLDQKTTAGNQGARNPFAGRRQKWIWDKNKSETKIITAGPRWINGKISGPTHLRPDKSMHHHPRCSFFSWFLPLLRCGGASNARIILIMMVLTETLLPEKLKPPIIR